MAIFVVGFLAFFTVTGSTAAASPQGSWDSTPNHISATSPVPGTVYRSDVAIGDDGVTTFAWGGSDGLVIATDVPGEGIHYDDPIAVPGSHPAPTIATGKDGSVVVASMAYNGSVWVTSRTSAGTFGPLEQVSPGNSDSDSYSGGGTLEVSTARGFVSIAWIGTSGPVYTVQTSTRSPGGRFSTPVSLSPSADIPGRDAGYLHLAMDRSGLATVVWQQAEPGKHLILAATQISPGGSFRNPVTLSKVDAAPSLAISRSGTTIVGWAKQGTVDTFQYVTRTRSRSFSLPRERSFKGGAFTHALTGMDISNDGTLTVTTVSSLGIEVLTRRPGKRFGPPVLIKASLGEDTVYGGKLSMAPDGTVNVLLRVDPDAFGEYDVEVATRLPGGEFAEPVQLASPGSVGADISSGPGGKATVTWLYGPGTYDFGDIDLAAVSTFPDDLYCENTSFRLGAFNPHRKSGTGRITAVAGAPGHLELLPSPLVKKAETDITGAGQVKLAVKAKGGALRKLKKAGSVTLTARVRYSPGLGCKTRTAKSRIKLVLGGKR